MVPLPYLRLDNSPPELLKSPHFFRFHPKGRIAQLGERHVYTVDVTGSSPVPPTILRGRS